MAESEATKNLGERNRSLPIWLLYPAIFLPLLSIYLLTWWSPSSSNVWESFMSQVQIVGTILLFASLPAYLAAVVFHQRGRTLDALAAVADVAQPEALSAARAAVKKPFSVPVHFAAVVGVIFGIWQNAYVVGEVIAGRGTLFDALLIVGNCLVWASAMYVLATRLRAARSLSVVGESLAIDVYALDRLRPLAQLATWDVLLVTGAMAHMPLLSIDAELRAENYVPGLILGFTAAFVLFWIPMIGYRRRRRTAKSDRLHALELTLQQIDRANLADFEVALSHRDRIAGLSDWPVDLALAWRVMISVVIPPFAWVAAALVENLLDVL